MKWLRRYFSITLAAVVAFVMFVLFFNENSFMRNVELKREIEALKAEIRDNEGHPAILAGYARESSTPIRETMEKIVREQYHMQRPSEDVYVTD